MNKFIIKFKKLQLWRLWRKNSFKTIRSSRHDAIWAFQCYKLMIGDLCSSDKKKSFHLSAHRDDLHNGARPLLKCLMLRLSSTRLLELSSRRQKGVSESRVTRWTVRCSTRKIDEMFSSAQQQPLAHVGLVVKFYCQTTQRDQTFCGFP